MRLSHQELRRGDGVFRRGGAGGEIAGYTVSTSARGMFSRVTRRSRGLSDVLADLGGAPVAVAGAAPGQLAAESPDPAAPSVTWFRGSPGPLALQDVDRAALRPDESRRTPGRGEKGGSRVTSRAFAVVAPDGIGAIAPFCDPRPRNRGVEVTRKPALPRTRPEALAATTGPFPAGEPPDWSGSA